MEASAPVKKAPKPKPPCKWGPRKADGYCPTKSESLALTASGSSSTKRSASAKPCKYGPRDSDGYCPKKPQTQAQVTRQVKAVTKVATEAVPAFIESGGIAAAKAGAKAVLSGKAIGTVITGGAAAATGALSVTIAAAALAGIASYYGTTWILEQLAQKKLANTADYRKYEAANAYRAARNQAAKELGRELTSAEHKYLSDRFKAELKKIGG